MFYKAIQQIQAVRKFVDYRKVDCADYPLLAQKLDDVSYSLTMIMKDLTMCDKIVRANNIQNNNEDTRK